MNDAQRKFVHKLVSKYGIIEVHAVTTQWRISPICLQAVERHLLDYDGFDTAKRVVAVFGEKASHEERIVMQSFLMEFLVNNFSNIKIPEVLDTDIKDSTELIDYLIAEASDA